MIDWSRYKNFREDEFRCKHTGKSGMRPEFMDILQQIRTVAGFPFVIASGYRHPTHPLERGKPGGPGEHTFGVAADITIYGERAVKLMSIALAHGIQRIGVSQHGDLYTRYLHLGIGDRNLHFPKTVWSYT